MFRLVCVTCLFLVFGAVAEAGIICTPIFDEVRVVAVADMGTSSDSEEGNPNVSLGVSEMTGMAAVSFDGESSTSVANFNSLAFHAPVHVEIVCVAKQFRVANPCLDGLLKPPQDLCSSSV